MSDEREQTAMQHKAREAGAADDEEEDDEDDAPSPFDHPAFLPALLFAMTLWFGYDGWFSETIESVNFNRYGFFFLLGATVYFLLADFTRLRFLLPALFLAYAVWLGLFHLVGPEDAWWKESEDELLSSANFNRWGAIACFGLAALALLRDLVRGRGPTEEPAS